MMNYQFFDSFIKNLQDDFSRNDFATALTRIQAGYVDYPEQSTILDFWQILLFARLGEPETAMSVMEASLETGNWFSEVLLRRSPSTQSLQGDPKFELLIARNQEIAEADRAGQFPYYVLRPEGKCKAGDPPCPTLIGLHSSGGTVTSSLDFWKSAASFGWLTAIPQSSQALMKGVNVWDDRLIAEEDIRQDLSGLMENYSVNPWQTVLAGHATSSDFVIWLILSKKVEIGKFLSINPSGSGILDFEAWSSVLDEYQPQMFADIYSQAS